MSYTVEDRSRVGRSTYWMFYIGIMIATWGMYGWAIYEYVKFNLFPIVFGFFAPLILGIYFRVIASRRCRDIGWPAFLPWASWVLPVVCGAIGGMNAASHTMASMGRPSSEAIAGMGMTVVIGMVLGLVDFVFLIVIGCMDSQGGGYDPSSGHSYDVRSMPQAPRGFLGDLDGAPMGQRAARIPQSFDSAPSAPAPMRDPHGDRPAGFGRRGV